MATVRDVANYFLLQTDEEAGDIISNLKLQKLIYYAQGFHLALKGTPLFNEPLQAWNHGPVSPALYHVFKEYGAGALPIPADCNAGALTPEETELLDEVYAVYGQFSAWKLRDLTHDEAPWKNSFREGINAPISHQAMQEFFRTQLS